MGANCAASASLGILFCCKGCNAEKLRNAFAYIPPQHSSYAVEDGEDGVGRMIYVLEGLRTYALYVQAAQACSVHWVNTRKGQRIPIAWIRLGSTAGAYGRASASGGKSSSHPYVVLHCHGNATDIGMMMGAYWELAHHLGIIVVGVEYSGYGVATGKPSSGNTYADAEAAYEHLIQCGVPPDRIVAYGQSVGSGPVMSLAAKHDMAGVILHSPLLSGIKVIDPKPDQCCRPSCMFGCFDFYPNDKRMKVITCPALIIHGQKDEVVPFYHGAKLHHLCPSGQKWQPYFPRNAGHNDIVESNALGYFNEVAHFLQGLEKNRANGDSALPPMQVEMTDRTQAHPQVSVGPEDGRYDHMRHGANHAQFIGADGQNQGLNIHHGDSLEVCIGASQSGTSVDGPDTDLDPHAPVGVAPAGGNARTLQINNQQGAHQ